MADLSPCPLDKSGNENDCEQVFPMATMPILLEAKTKLEKDRKMTEGLAGCFSQAMEMMRKYRDIFCDCTLLIQADGNFLRFSHCQKDVKTYILWYDQYQKTVQTEHLPW